MSEVEQFERKLATARLAEMQSYVSDLPPWPHSFDEMTICVRYQDGQACQVQIERHESEATKPRWWRRLFSRWTFSIRVGRS